MQDSLVHGPTHLKVALSSRTFGKDMCRSAQSHTVVTDYHMATEHCKCSLCNRGTEFSLNLIPFSWNSHREPVATILNSVALKESDK
jgi:hypothetical protein